jgi:competence protein ComEC
MNKVLTIIEHTPYAGINKIWITIPEYLLLYGIIISLFYFLFERRSWLLKLSLCFTLLLAISISFKRWNNLTSQGITFLSLRKHTGIVFKKGDQAVVLSDLSDTDKNYRYSIQPFLDSCQVSSLKIVDPKSDIQLSYLSKKGNLIQFGDKRILLFDKQLQQINLPQKIKSDYIYVADNPKIDMDFINRNYQYDLLIIDNTNSNALINRLKEVANAIHINYRVLHRNKSVTVLSN